MVDSEAPGRSLLSRGMILEHMEKGSIVIEPFDPRNLKTTSYDLRLGFQYYQERLRSAKGGVFNPFDQKHVEAHWDGPHKGERAGDWMERSGIFLENISPDEYIIPIAPGQTILAHTEEFIGGRNCVGQEMRARSSMGRIGITVCKCAGWGDIGYINRWTMEITNVLQEATVTLVVGMRVAQLIFLLADPLTGSYAAETGKYQASDNLEELIRSWKPQDMIPKLYKDYELKEGFPKPREITTA